MSFQFLSDSAFGKLGFRCGLEVHQQLLTEKKLFCRCPARRYSKSFDADSCCGKAHAQGKACAHPCCVKAIQAKKVCLKCNPGAKAKT